MVTLLEPLAGQVAVTIFTLGLIAAGISSQFPNVALLPWLLDDYNNRKTDLKRTHYRIIALIISLLGLVVPIFEAKPISVMIASQAFGALILPATVASIFYVGNKRNVMKTHVFGFITNAVLVLIFAFALVMSYMSINGIIATVQSV